MLPAKRAKLASRQPRVFLLAIMPLLQFRLLHLQLQQFRLLHLYAPQAHYIASALAFNLECILSSSCGLPTSVWARGKGRTPSNESPTIAGRGITASLRGEAAGAIRV